MDKTVCQLNACTGCMACVNICSQNAIFVSEGIETYNAEINPEKCIGCGMCKRVCPNIKPCKTTYPIYCKQGWTNDEKIRKNSSSGGVASSLIKSFIESGGYVASCLFKNGEFKFEITNDINVARKFAGSKYVKSNPGNVYKEIKSLIRQDKRVLFIGLPCQSAAVQNICGNENLYTVDLICHGTPSPYLLKKYLDEKGYDWNKITDIQFRDKANWGLLKNGIGITPSGVMDCYLRAFLYSIDYTENCYHCRYASGNRVSDITLGDAWGLMADEVSEGVSLILCQNQKGINLIESANLHLEEADINRAIEGNPQLKQPANKHHRRDKFLRAISKQKTFRWATFISFPKDSVKQSINASLIKLKLKKENVKGGYRLTLYY